ncbi:MAG: hypothetical protein M1377_03740 [Deltaproteobacteria bacterium]|nr:hypothetical protein [Deltaproteobacteria bacterium]
MKRRALYPQPWWLHDDLTFWAPLCDPVNPLAIYRGAGPLSMTRATAALRFDGTKFVSVGNNVLRIEPKGALIEGPRVNSMLLTDTSQDLLAQWTKVGITATFDDDANGYGGKRWALVADASDRQFVRSITIPAAAYSLAFYVRKADGSAVIAADCNIYCDNANAASAYTLIGNGIYRVSSENFTGANAARNSGLTVKANKTVHLVAPPQLEAGIFCSSPVPTTAGTATRNGDKLTFPKAGILDGAVGTLAMGIDFNGGLQYERILGNAADAGAGQTYIQPFGPTLTVNDGAGKMLNVISAGNATHRIAIAWSAQLKGVTDGGAVVAEAFAGDMAFDDNPVLGSNTAGGREIFGHLRDLRIWNRAFTSAELQNITR